MWPIYVFIIMKKSLSFCIFFFIPYLFICQTSNLINDIQSWNSFELQYQKINKTEFSVESGVRFYDNLNNVSKFLTDFTIKREYNKYIDYAVGLRYDRRKNNTALEDRFRWYLDCYLHYKIYPNMTLKARTRYQAQSMYDDLFQSSNAEFNDVDIFTKKIRQKITLNNKMKNETINIYFASEFFYEIGFGFEKYRFVSGLKKKISKKFGVSISGLFQSDFNGDKDNAFFALRTKLIYSI